MMGEKAFGSYMIGSDIRDRFIVQKAKRFGQSKVCLIAASNFYNSKGGLAINFKESEAVKQNIYPRYSDRKPVTGKGNIPVFKNDCGLVSGNYSALFNDFLYILC